MVVASPRSASLQPSPTDNPDPVALIDAWLAVEALQPQTFATQEDLLGREPPPAKRTTKGKRDAPLPRALFPFDLASGQMPWEGPEGDRQQLAMAEDDRLVWYVPLGFVKMEPAVERLVTQVEPEGPERERGAGVAVLALAAFDETGRALPSNLLLSSFGWACGRVLAGEIDQLHTFVDIEGELRHQLGQALVQLDLDGRKVATSRQRFLEGMATIMAALGLPADLLERPRVAIRVVASPTTTRSRSSTASICAIFTAYARRCGPVRAARPWRPIWARRSRPSGWTCWPTRRCWRAWSRRP